MNAQDYQRRKLAYIDLLDLPVGERALRIAQIEASDPTLAAGLRAQLAAAELPQTLLDRVSHGSSPPALPQYRLIRELGRGGMGRVWLAERNLGDATQQVALKQIVHANWHEADQRRFERERRILASLEHPHIAALVDGGSDAQGAPYLATVFVDGQRLDHFVASQALALVDRVQLLVKIASAVSYAHRRLVVHRDLKPANILVDRDGAPKLLDFGVARLLAEEAITTTGPSQMTLRYAAPEQLHADGGESAGVASDIYALGVLLYELIANASPYPQPNDQRALLAAILQHEPAPPSSGTSLAGANADLDAIVLKALRKRPEDRYASAEALAVELQRWLRGEPVEARHGEHGYRLRTWLRQRWPWLAAASVAAVFLAYHIVTLDQQLDRVKRERDRAQALASYFGELFKNAKPAETDQGDISARELLERSVAGLHADAAAPPATRATLLLAAGDALSYLGHGAKARDAFAQAVHLLRTVAPTEPETLARAHSELASELDRTGDLPGARREIAAAVRLFDEGKARDESRYLTVLQQAAIFAEEAGDRSTARAGYEHIVATTRSRLNTPESIDSYLGAQTNLATLEQNSGDTPAAERRLREALAAAQQHGVNDLKLLLPMRAYLGRTLYDQQRLAEARAVLEPMSKDAGDFFGDNDPWLAVLQNYYATLSLLDGNAAQAARIMDESLRRTARSFGDAHPNAWAQRSDRALASLMLGEWSDAIRRYEAVLAWRASNGKPPGMNTQFERAAQAYARCRLDASETRRSELREALRDSQKFRGFKRWLVNDWIQQCGASP